MFDRPPAEALLQADIEGVRRDTVTIDRLFRVTKQRLFALLLRQTRNREEAADIMQTAFARLIVADRSGAIEDKEAYLFEIARKLVVDFARSRDLEARKKTALTALASNEVSERISPEATAVERERLGFLVASIRKLPRQRRKIFLLYRFEHLSCEEIALRESIAESTVRKHLVRAKRDIQLEMAKLEG